MIECARQHNSGKHICCEAPPAVELCGKPLLTLNLRDSIQAAFDVEEVLASRMESDDIEFAFEPAALSWAYSYTGTNKVAAEGEPFANQLL